MHRRRIRSAVSLLAVLAAGALVAGCGAGRAFGRGESAARAGDWDAAVAYYRQAVQENPDRVDYQIALERAMLTASVRHLDQARVLEARGQIEDALREYRRASEYDPSNRQIASKVTVLHEGQLLSQGTMKEVARNPKVIEVYLGQDREEHEAKKV